MFGSAAQGLYLPDGFVILQVTVLGKSEAHIISDIDLTVLMNRDMSQQETKRSLFRMASKFKGAEITDKVDVRWRARIPILSFKTTPQFGE